MSELTALGWPPPPPGKFGPWFDRWNEYSYAFGLAARVAGMGQGTDDLDFPVLDIGCGDCALYKRLRETGWTGTYVGFDVDPTPDPALVSVGDVERGRIVLRKLDFAAMERLPIPSSDEQVYEAAFCLQVIEHLPRDRQPFLISELQRVAKRVVITTPNREYTGRCLSPEHLTFSGHIGMLSLDELNELAGDGAECGRFNMNGGDAQGRPWAVASVTNDTAADMWALWVAPRWRRASTGARRVWAVYDHEHPGEKPKSKEQIPAAQFMEVSHEPGA